MGGPARARVVAGSVLLLASVAFAATRVGGLQGRPSPNEAAGAPAPDFTGIDAWLNSEPLTIGGLRGTVVLVDFWTFSCVNCVRTFPHLRALYDRYHPFGLQIVGIHAPEFDFEKDADNVAGAIERHGLPYPVALDNEMETWRAYENNYWPHVYLIDADGVIRFDHIGEGAEEDIQAEVRALLTEAGKTLPAELDLSETGPSARITPEIYAGYERGVAQDLLASAEGFGLDAVVDYAAPADAQVARAGTSGAWFLEGPWRAQPEYVEAAGDGARVILPFFARDVFFVAEGPARARVLLDGAEPGARAGEGVTAGVVEVDRSDLFALVRLERAGQHVLTIEAGRGFRLYTFTFG